MVSLLDSLQGTRVETSEGYVHQGAYSRGEDDHTPTDTDKPCPDCKNGFKYLHPNGAMSSYCKECTERRARGYRAAWYKRKRDAKMCGPKGAGSGKPRSTLCPQCKLRPRGETKSGKRRVYCKECERKRVNEARGGLKVRKPMSPLKFGKGV